MMFRGCPVEIFEELRKALRNEPLYNCNQLLNGSHNTA